MNDRSVISRVIWFLPWRVEEMFNRYIMPKDIIHVSSIPCFALWGSSSIGVETFERSQLFLDTLAAWHSSSSVALAWRCFKGLKFSIIRNTMSFNVVERRWVRGMWYNISVVSTMKLMISTGHWGRYLPSKSYNCLIGLRAISLTSINVSWVLKFTCLFTSSGEPRFRKFITGWDKTILKFQWKLREVQSSESSPIDWVLDAFLGCIDNCLMRLSSCDVWTPFCCVGVSSLSWSL